MPSLVVPERFEGPPGCANGGWVTGALAEALGAEATEVRLRRPVPTGVPLAVVEDDDRSGLRLEHDGEVLAEARPATLETAAPRVEPDAAAAAEARYPGFARHPFPRCFACGPEREPGDGLRLFNGPVEGREDVLACTWTPDAALCDPVPTPIVGAALDCPSSAPHIDLAREQRPLVLGTLAVRVRAPVRAGRRHVVVAWGDGVEGRRHRSRSAVLGPRGDVLAVAAATWIELRVAEAA